MQPGELGNRIKARRQLLNMTQEELAEKLGVHQVTLSQYETGKRSFPSDDLRQLADILTVPIAYFYGDDDIDGPTMNSYYEGLPPADRAVADEVIRSLWLKSQRDQTTHGPKAE